MRGTMKWLTGIAVLVVLACAGEAESASEAEGTGEAAAVSAAPPATTTEAQTAACAPMTANMALEGRASPYDSVLVTVGGRSAKICYGRPAARGRTMIGGEAVPYGQLWRTGANEPTTLHLPFAANIAGIDVDPGTYTLYTMPGLEQWVVILNRSTTQWGHEGRYTAEVRAQEVGRGMAPVTRAPTYAEVFTIRSETAGADATLILEWENSRVAIPVRAR